MKKRLYLVLPLWLIALSLIALRAEYNVNSLGIKIADLEIEMERDFIDIKIESTKVLPLFPHINNRYIIRSRGDFIPERYKRIVHQGELLDEIEAVYEVGVARMTQQSVDSEYVYDIADDTRDFFSLLNLICNTAKPQRKYIVDGNSRAWEASVSPASAEKIKTKIGSFNARKHVLSFKPLSPEKAPYMDMLTHNLLSEDIVLTLWISSEGVPLKAQIKKKLMGMNWEIKELKR